MNAPATLTTAKIVADEHGISWTVNLTAQAVTAIWRNDQGAAQHTSAAFVLDGENDKTIVDAAIVRAVMDAYRAIVRGQA